MCALRHECVANQRIRALPYISPTLNGHARADSEGCLGTKCSLTKSKLAFRILDALFTENGGVAAAAAAAVAAAARYARCWFLGALVKEA